MSRFTALASVLASRLQLARAGNITFDGKRDMNKVLGYPEKINLGDYRTRYERGDIAKTIVEAYPDATWRGGGELIEDPDPSVITQFEEIWNEMNDRLHIWSAFQQVDIEACIAQYAVLLIGAPGDIAQEIPKTGPEGIVYLIPFAQENAPVNTWEEDTTNPRYGQPLTYKLKRIGANGRSIERETHWTRVLHVSEGDRVFGKPRLEAPWNRLLDLDKVAGGGAEAFWMRANAGMQLDLDKDIPPENFDKKALMEEIEEYEHGLRRIFRTQGITTNQLGSDVANFAPPVEALISIIAATTRIPQRILMGSERGELASTQDRSNWEQRIADRRNAFAGPRVVRPFVSRLQECGVLPEVEEYDIWWPEIRNLTESEKAAVLNQYATANRNNGRTIVTVDEMRDSILERGPIEEVDDFDEEVDLPQPPPQLNENNPVDGEIVEERAAGRLAVAKSKLLRRQRKLRGDTKAVLAR